MSLTLSITQSAYGTNEENLWTETYYVIDINNTLKTSYSEKSKSATKDYNSRTSVNQTGNKGSLANYMIIRTFLKADEGVTAPQTTTKVDVSVERTRTYFDSHTGKNLEKKLSHTHN